MFEAYRVMKEFQWDGWVYAPNPDGPCLCAPSCNNDPENESCIGAPGTLCGCCGHCVCRIAPELYGGDIWLVGEGHPRKPFILEHRYAVYDASLDPIDELLKNEKFKRLTVPLRPVAAKPSRQPAQVSKPLKPETDDERHELAYQRV